LRIEPGLHAGSSEIVLIHITRPRASIDTELVIWPRLSDSEDREFALLQRASQYLADRTDIYSSSSSSLLAGSLEGERKAILIENRGLGPVLELRISLNRAWAQVGGALDQAEIAVNNRDRDNNVFEVAFDGLRLEEDSPGFLSRVFGNDDETTAPPMNRFEVALEETQEHIRVTARPLDSPTLTGLETELLQAILSNL
jgi:outer membrane protein assembly factor BamC